MGEHYFAPCKVKSWGIGETKRKDLRVDVEAIVKTESGKKIIMYWHGYLTGGALKVTKDTLRILGFKKVDEVTEHNKKALVILSDTRRTDTLDTNTVFRAKVVIDEDVTTGKKYQPKIKNFYPPTQRLSQSEAAAKLGASSTNKTSYRNPI